MGKEPEWKVDKQPAWLVAAIRRTIADLPHGYEEAAEILGLYKSDDITQQKINCITDCVAVGIKFFHLSGPWFYRMPVVPGM